MHKTAGQIAGLNSSVSTTRTFPAHALRASRPDARQVDRLPSYYVLDMPARAPQAQGTRTSILKAHLLWVGEDVSTRGVHNIHRIV